MEHREIRAAASVLRHAADRLTRLQKRSEALEKDINKAADALAEKQLVRFLSNMSVDELNRDKQGIRVSALKSAGISDIGQLYGRSKASLESIPGVGEVGAHRIYRTVCSIADSARESIRPRLSADDKSAEFARLIRALYMYSRLERPMLAALELIYDLLPQAEKALKDSQSARSRLSWLFASRSIRAQAEASLAELFALAYDGFADNAEALCEEFERADAMPAADPAADFTADPARYAITLEYVSGFGGEDDSGAVPEELALAVNARKLDLSHLKATLRPYQLFGTKYILSQRRSLLGDEMGLGKTVQAIAAMAALKAEGAGHFLVVCPAGVLVNWCREIIRFSDLAVTEIHGADKSDELYRWISSGCVAVTTYETARALALPEGFRLDMLVADEAHYVKNPEALRTRALIRLCNTAQNVLLMTGTPLENKVDEMCALLDILNSETAEKARELRYISRAPQFRECIAGVYLRRTRADVLTELPEKIEKDQWCRPTLEDLKGYFAHVLAKNFMGMRRIGWHTDKLESSSKARRLLEIIEQARAEGRKVLVFSFFRATAEKVMLLAGENAFGPINGSLPSANRQKLVDAFTAAPPGAVLACQITAGGTGLNIQTASVVVFCEPQIKPSLETQAISRAYRMGQARTVLVYRLLCEHTIDEEIVSILRDKQELFDCFADESAVGVESLENEETKGWIDRLIAAELEKIDSYEC